MIYTPFGQPVRIIADSGAHQPRPGANFKCRLVLVEATDDPTWQRWRFAESLKSDADGREIFIACDNAPKVTLSRSDLVKARRQAQ